jgi:hypothetical protein
MANVSVATGSHGAYRWLTTSQHEFDTLLRRCPQTVVGKYLAVTSLDSGAMALTDAEISDGWQSRNEIAYSPIIQSAENLRTVRFPNDCTRFNEWYVFDFPVDLGGLWHGDNVFDAPMTPRQVHTFVNFDAGFDLHNPEVPDLVALFWKQLDWIRPESYIADSDSHLTFVSRNDEMFATVRNVLSDMAPNA